MVFTQGRGFVFGASFGLKRRSLRCRGLVCHPADTASLATWILFGKLFGVATLVGFGEKRCRKNLPLAAPIRAVTSKNHQCPECHGHDVIALVYKNRKLRTMFSDDWNATVGRRIVTDNAEFAKNKDGSPKHRGDAKYRCRTCNHEW